MTYSLEAMDDILDDSSNIQMNSNMGLSALDDIPTESIPEDGNSPLARFTVEWEKSLEAKAQEEHTARNDAIQKAKQELAQFHQDRELLREQKAKNNREADQLKLEQVLSDLDSENPWERVVSLVDIATVDSSSVDISRMKSIFIQLKADGAGKD